MTEYPPIPDGKKLPFVDQVTNRLNEPTMDAIVQSIIEEPNTFTETQTFDPDNGVNIGGKLHLKLTDGFFGQRLHLTGLAQAPGVDEIMPYFEVAPVTRVGTDVGGAVAGIQVYGTPGGGAVPNREFLAIEFTGETGSNPLEFKISPWSSGTGVTRPVSFWDGIHKVATIRNNGGTGALEIQPEGRLTYVDTGTTASTPILFQKQGTQAIRLATYSGTAASESYIFTGHNRVSIAAPGVPVVGDSLGSFRVGAIDAGTERAGAFIRGLATETWVYASARGTKLSINTTPATTATTQVQAEFDEPAANEVGLLVRVDRSGTKTLSRVSIGAADSGGTGFRVLRVAN